MTSDTSLHNWIGKYGLECAPKNEFGYFGSAYFAGIVISCLIIPRLSDIYGRKWFAIFGSSLHILSALVIIFSTSFKLTLFCLFMVGFAMGARCFVGYAFITEHMKQSDSAKVTSATFFLDSMGIFFASLYFKYISR